MVIGIPIACTGRSESAFFLIQNNHSIKFTSVRRATVFVRDFNVRTSGSPRMEIVSAQEFESDVHPSAVVKFHLSLRVFLESRITDVEHIDADFVAFVTELPEGRIVNLPFELDP